MRLLSLLGTIEWFACAVVHPVLVDIDLALGGHLPIVPKVRTDAVFTRPTLVDCCSTVHLARAHGASLSAVELSYSPIAKGASCILNSPFWLCLSFAIA